MFLKNVSFSLVGIVDKMPAESRQSTELVLPVCFPKLRYPNQLSVTLARPLTLFRLHLYQEAFRAGRYDSFRSLVGRLLQPTLISDFLSRFSDRVHLEVATSSRLQSGLILNLIDSR